MIVKYTPDERRRLDALEAALVKITEKYKLLASSIDRFKKDPTPEDYELKDKILLQGGFINLAKIKIESIQHEAWARELSKLENDPDRIIENAREQAPLVVNDVMEGAVYIQPVDLIAIRVGERFFLHRLSLIENAPERLPELENILLETIKSDPRVSPKHQYYQEPLNVMLWKLVGSDDPQTAEPTATTLFPEFFLTAIDKITRNTFENSFSSDLIPVRIEGKGKKPMTTMVSVDFEGLDESVQIKRELTHYDSLVHNAVLTLYDGRNRYITAQMIYQLMTGDINANLNQKQNGKQAEEISAALTKMMYTRVVIDASDEEKQYRNMEQLQFDSPMIPAQRVTVTLNGQRVECLELIAIPPLYQYAKQKNQIGRTPIKLLKTEINKTAGILVLQSYLNDRILTMKSGHLSKTIKYQTIYDHLGIEAETPGAERKKKAKIRSQAKRILDDWVKLNWITGYKEKKEKQMIYSLIIDPREKT